MPKTLTTNCGAWHDMALVADQIPELQSEEAPTKDSLAKMLRKVRKDHLKRVRETPPPLSRRDRELAALGNPTDCGLCGRNLMVDGKDLRCVEHRHDTGVVRGVTCIRCNWILWVADLRFSDPDRWQKILAWSNRGAPPVTPKVRTPKRRIRKKDPVLFPTE